MTDDHDDVQMPSPEGLEEGLRALYGTRVMVPREVDEAVLGAARRRLGRRRGWGWAAAGAVAASAVVVVGILAVGRGQPKIDAPLPAVSDRVSEDIDGDGRVDILNGDGVVDKHDVDRVASAAVRLNGEEL